MIRLIALLALLPGMAFAGDAENLTHNACMAHVATVAPSTGRKVVRSAGYEAGWEKCAAFEAQYQADLAAARNSGAAARATAAAARDAAAQTRLNQ